MFRIGPTRTTPRHSIQNVAVDPFSDRTSLQPKSGLTGAQVRDRARHSPSQSLALLQLWFASGVFS